MIKWLVRALLLFSVPTTVACSNPSLLVQEEIVGHQWVSNVLFEAPDYRDVLEFRTSGQLLFFSAVDAVEYSGSYSVVDNRIRAQFRNSTLDTVIVFNLIYADSVLQVDRLQDNVRRGYFYRAPFDREKL